MLWGPDVEGEAESILAGEGFPVDEPPDVDTLARCVLGAAHVVESRMLSAPARWVASTDEIIVRPGLSRRRRRYLLAHELAERHLRRLLYQREDVERLADALAAALCVPRRALRAALSAVGRHLPELSELLRASQSVVALRLGEVTGSPLALVTPRAVHVRGEPWGWPDEHAVRALVRGPVPRELELVPVTDALRRVALVAA